MVGCAGERRELQGKMLQTMKAKEIPFRRLATETGLPPFRIVAALLGQGTLPKNVAAKVATLLELPELEDFLIEGALSGSPGREFPTDPFIDRLYEIVRVYGTTLKVLMEEKFGEGNMSAIDFDLDLRRQPDPRGDRVTIVMTGKFLKYKKYYSTTGRRNRRIR
jgi:cyanate lyase